ncbi:hypothetical protein H4S07_004037 [Coemansia furcata]|uniref:Uncharacterized protein n=1 Tax=Coemansia furcata TaxID=417177 RepID=A0ACC1LCJ5_9FUNG|nr:hypothetical protein H4S07_004037 [Coemansia furcata]
MYKRSAGRPAPPLPRSRNGSSAADKHASLAGEGGDGVQSMLPTVAVSPAGGHAGDKRPIAFINGTGNGMDDEDDSDSSDAKLVSPPDPNETGEERRTTRRLVESALRGCHEARILAVNKT